MQATLSSLSAAQASGKLTARDQAGANILIDKFTRFGNWTAAQQQWADDILRRATESGAAVVPAIPGLTPPTQKVGPEYQKVVDLLKTPGSKLVKPTITLMDDAGQRLSITLLPSGDTIVRRPHPALPRRGWMLATIKADGAYRETSEMTYAAADLLERLGDDPTGTAFANARKTGLCCFCNRKLEPQAGRRAQHQARVRPGLRRQLQAAVGLMNHTRPVHAGRAFAPSSRRNAMKYLVGNWEHIFPDMKTRAVRAVLNTEGTMLHARIELSRGDRLLTRIEWEDVQESINDNFNPEDPEDCFDLSFADTLPAWIKGRGK